MSVLTARLVLLDIHNTYALLRCFSEEKNGVAVTYKTAEGVHPNYTMVWSPWFNTDPQSRNWYDRQMKTFIGNRAMSFDKAKDWAGKKYGITEWAPSPFGGHVPKYVVDAAKADIKRKQHEQHR